MRRLAQTASGQPPRSVAASVSHRALAAPRPASIAGPAAAQPRVRASLVLRLVAQPLAARRSSLHEPRAR